MSLIGISEILLFVGGLPFVYVFVVPKFTGNKVLVKIKGILPLALFGILLACSFVPTFLLLVLVTGEFFLGNLYELFLKGIAIPTGVAVLLHVVFFLWLAQLAFFLVTYVTSLLRPTLVFVESAWAAWEAALIPATFSFYFYYLILAVASYLHQNKIQVFAY